MAIHSALQVFHPKTRGTSDGLYNVRYYIYFVGFVIPIMMASLAFINPGDAYLSQGAFCTLPIRPFWYRLALSWIPRYLIAAIILGLAIAIYAYVGFEFRSYASASQSFNTPSNTTGISRIEKDTEAAVDGARSAEGTAESLTDGTRRNSLIAHDVVASPRRGSAVAFAERQSMTRASTIPDSHTQSLPESMTHLTIKRSNSLRPPLVVIPSGHSVKLEPEPSPSPTYLESGTFSPTTKTFANPMESLTSQTAPTTPTTPTPKTRAPPESPPSAAARQLRRQRMRIHRQLRLMFIYPLVYTLMWLIPFVQHCLTYSDHFANNPVFFLRIGTAICITSMGFVDCLIFSIREKPWKSIQTSDGTLWGSFAVWRSPSVVNAGMVVRRSMTGGSVDGGAPADEMAVARLRGSVRTSASDDISRIAIEQARARLELERVERLARMKERIQARRKSSLGTDGMTDSEENLNGESEYSVPSEKERGGGGEDESNGKEREGDAIDRVDWKREG